MRLTNFITFLALFLFVRSRKTVDSAVKDLPTDQNIVKALSDKTDQKYILYNIGDDSKEEIFKGILVQLDKSLEDSDKAIHGEESDKLRAIVLETIAARVEVFLKILQDFPPEMLSSDRKRINVGPVWLLKKTLPETRSLTTSSGIIFDTLTERIDLSIRLLQDALPDFANNYEKQAIVECALWLLDKNLAQAESSKQREERIDNTNKMINLHSFLKNLKSKFTWTKEERENFIKLEMRMEDCLGMVAKF